MWSEALTLSFFRGTRMHLRPLTNGLIPLAMLVSIQGRPQALAEVRFRRVGFLVSGTRRCCAKVPNLADIRVSIHRQETTPPTKTKGRFRKLEELTIKGFRS